MSKRSVGLDVLRAVCVLGVLATHFSQFFIPSGGAGALALNALTLGSFGVSGFFLLSAYLLTGILLREVGTKQTRIWRRYWIRRALRIWPLYYLTILAVLVGALVTSKSVSGLPWLSTFTYNWTSWNESNTLLSHFWSMCVEEQLYVLIPILCFTAFKWRVPLLVAFIVAAPVSRWFISDLFPYPAVWSFTTSHLDVFALGVLLASLDYAKSARWQRLRRVITGGWWVAAIAGLLILTLIVAAIVDPQRVFAGRDASWTYLAAALVWAWLLLKSTQKPWTRFNPTVKSAVWVGQRSYGIYVYHWPAVMFGAWLETEINIASQVIGIVLIAAVFVVSEVSFRVIENPFLKLKARFSRDATPAYGSVTAP